MSWIIPVVCGLLAAFVLGPVVGRILRDRANMMPTDDEVKKAEIELHVKHLARMNQKGIK